MTAQLQAHNHQSEERVPIRRLQREWRQALTLLPASRHPLPQKIAIHLVSVKQIQEAHRDFLDDDTPTDVITFPDGEILISPRIAARQGPPFSRTTEEEVLLYGIHALLHLQNREDHTPSGFKLMSRLQESIFQKIRPPTKNPRRPQ